MSEENEASDQTTDAPAEEDVDAPPSRGRWLSNARRTVAAGAAAVLLAGGLGGFAIGRATADHGAGRGADQQGVSTGFNPDGEDRGGPGGGPGGPGGPVLGQLPDGTQPGVPGQDDEQDGEDDEADGSNT